MHTAPDSLPGAIQDLPPKWAHFCLHVEQFIRDDLGIDLTEKTILSAFSGGVDSTALLLAMHVLSRKNGGDVVAVHLNHQLRSEADDDALWAQSFCNALKVPCVIRTIDIVALSREQGIGLEEAGRNARYDLFKEILETHPCDLLAMGHHLDDLAEDMLMRLARGTGWPGLSGMASHDPGRSLIRPFLLVQKSTLTHFLTDLNIPWREDASNSDPSMTRNRVRHSILPMFLEENPNFLESVARLWKIGSLDQDYWNTEVASADSFLPAELLNKSHKAKRLRLYKASLAGVGERGQALAETLFKLDTAWVERRSGTVFQFPGDRIATITHSGVVFSAKH